MILKKYLGEIITEMGFVTKEDLEKALRKQKEICKAHSLPVRLQRSKLISEARMAAKSAPTLGQILTDMGVTTKEQLDRALKEQEKMLDAYNMLKSDKLVTVLEKGSLINSTLNIAEVLERIMKYANRVTNSTASTLMLLDENTGELVFSIPTGPKSEELIDMHIPSGKGIAGWVAKNEQHVLITDAKKDPRFYSKIDEISGFETKSILCVPLKAKAKLIGVLEVINKEDGTFFTKEDALLLSIFANQAAVGIENARYFGELKDRLEEEKDILKKFAESEKLRALGLMASGVAHDFNNMLSIILGNAELIESIEDRDRILKKVSIIKQAAIDSANTIKRLQMFTKAKTEDNRFLPLDINELVRSAVTITTPMWKDKPHEKGINVVIVYQLAKEELAMRGNVSDLREVIVNLIFNSVDAMPQGGKITITTYMKDENICLDISDSGTGMTEETINMIYDPFFTTKGPNHSGLGMSMAHGIIQRHHGIIELKTKHGKGTTFILKFPVRKEYKKTREEKAAPDVEIKKARILIIDDKPEISDLISDILSLHGHQTHVYCNGKDGIEALSKSDYDVLITVLGMQDMSGWTVANNAKQVKPNIRIGLLTGWDITPEEAKQKGVDFIINKPFQANDIKQAVANVLKR